MPRSLILSLLLLLSGSTLSLEAQEARELRGRITNSSDDPLPKVQVLDHATGRQLTETGKGGEFQLALPDSIERISLIFLAEGYQSKVMLLRPSSQVYRIILFEAQRSIEGVTVSRRRLQAVSGYAPLTSRFTTFDILITPRALGDILGGLMEDPDAQSSDTDGRLSLQGGAPHESQVYIDGLRLPNPYSISSKNSSVRSILSPSECKEINLLSGGYSASMGQALSGVIQILSRDTKDVKPGSLISLSNIGPSFTWGIGAPSSPTKVELSASYTDLSLYDRVLPSAYHYTRSFYSPSLTASLWHDLPQAMLKAQLSYTGMGLGYRPNASLPTFTSHLREDRYYGRLTYVRSLSTACGGKKNDQTTSNDSAQIEAIPLPELAEGEEVVFENDDVRIVERDISTDDIPMYNNFEIQPKHTGIEGFEISGSVLDFEGVAGNVLITSEGTGVVSTLWLHDMTTGEVLVPVDMAFLSGTLEIQGEDAVFFYSQEDNLPRVQWNEKKGAWMDANEVPDFLRNDQLKEAQQEVKEHLFEGLTLMALQKVKIDIKERKVTPLQEYKWSYIE
ncbi:MAG: hypothetical protein ACFNOQ_01160 [Porphyromonas sp.]